MSTVKRLLSAALAVLFLGAAAVLADNQPLMRGLELGTGSSGVKVNLMAADPTQ